MNSKQIDELFEAFNSVDYDKVFAMADIKPDDIVYDDDGEIDENFQDEVLRKLTQKIEQGDFDYFYSQKYKASEFTKLLAMSSRTDKIKEAIQRRDELNIHGYRLLELIKGTKDVDYIKSVIEGEERFDFNIFPDEIISLIAATGDIEYIKGIIESKEKKDKLGIRDRNLTKMIEATNDPNYIKKIIENPEIREEFEITNVYITGLIIGTHDTNYIKSIVESEEKRNKLDLDHLAIAELIVATHDMDYIKSIIENEGLRQRLGIDEKDTIRIVKVTDIAYIDNFLKAHEDKSQIQDSTEKLCLPENMTIGVEIESEGIYSPLILKLRKQFLDKWTCKGDGSLNNGVEVVSPILTGDIEQSTQSIKNVCRRLNNLRTNNI